MHVGVEVADQQVDAGLLRGGEGTGAIGGHRYLDTAGTGDRVSIGSLFTTFTVWPAATVRVLNCEFAIVMTALPGTDGSEGKLDGTTGQRRGSPPDAVAVGREVGVSRDSVALAFDVGVRCVDGLTVAEGDGGVRAASGQPDAAARRSRRRRQFAASTKSSYLLIRHCTVEWFTRRHNPDRRGGGAIQGKVS